MARSHFRPQFPLAGAARGGGGVGGRPAPPPLAGPPAPSPLAGGPGRRRVSPPHGRLRAAPPPARRPRRGGPGGGSPTRRLGSGLARRVPHPRGTIPGRHRRGGGELMGPDRPRLRPAAPPRPGGGPPPPA